MGQAKVGDRIKHTHQALGLLFVILVPTFGLNQSCGKLKDAVHQAERLAMSYQILRSWTSNASDVTGGRIELRSQDPNQLVLDYVRAHGTSPVVIESLAKLDQDRSVMIRWGVQKTTTIPLRIHIDGWSPPDAFESTQEIAIRNTETEGNDESRAPYEAACIDEEGNSTYLTHDQCRTRANQLLEGRSTVEPPRSPYQVYDLLRQRMATVATTIPIFGFTASGVNAALWLLLASILVELWLAYNLYFLSKAPLDEINQADSSSPLTEALVAPKPRIFRMIVFVGYSAFALIPLSVAICAIGVLINAKPSTVHLFLLLGLMLASLIATGFAVWQLWKFERHLMASD